MIKRLLFLLSALSILSPAVGAEALHGDYLYKVTTVRAAPGRFSDLLDWHADVAESKFYNQAGLEPPIILRHSQGDQWDLMIITPLSSFAQHFDKNTSAKREEAVTKHTDLLTQDSGLLAFEEDHFAYGPALPDFQAAYRGNELAHIEMFHALAGKATELFQQRQMENAYLSATGQTTNLIFRRAAGSDVDVFTIGFHRDLQAFAAPSSVTDDEKEAAAVKAGFKNRADLSFYLRSLISSHHDTLAVVVDRFIN